MRNIMKLYIKYITSSISITMNHTNAYHKQKLTLPSFRLSFFYTAQRFSLLCNHFFIKGPKESKTQRNYFYLFFIRLIFPTMKEVKLG